MSIPRELAFAGCEPVGTRLLDALGDAQISHALNPTSQRVTAGLGGASAWPDPVEAKGVGSLVEAADRAPISQGGRSRLPDNVRTGDRMAPQQAS